MERWILFWGLILKHDSWHYKPSGIHVKPCVEKHRGFFSTYFSFSSNHCIDMFLLRCLRKKKIHAACSDCATFRNIFMTGKKDSQLSQCMFQCMCMTFLSHRLMFMSFSNISQSVNAGKVPFIIKINSTWIKI